MRCRQACKTSFLAVEIIAEALRSIGLHGNLETLGLGVGEPVRALMNVGTARDQQSAQPFD
jgi:hypothetical protein